MTPLANMVEFMLQEGTPAEGIVYAVRTAELAGHKALALRQRFRSTVEFQISPIGDMIDELFKRGLPQSVVVSAVQTAEITAVLAVAPVRFILQRRGA